LYEIHLYVVMVHNENEPGAVESPVQERCGFAFVYSSSLMVSLQPTEHSPDSGNQPVADFPCVFTVTGKFELKCAVLPKGSEDQA